MLAQGVGIFGDLSSGCRSASRTCRFLAWDSWSFVCFFILTVTSLSVEVLFSLKITPLSPDLLYKTLEKQVRRGIVISASWTLRSVRWSVRKYSSLSYGGKTERWNKKTNPQYTFSAVQLTTSPSNLPCEVIQVLEALRQPTHPCVTVIGNHWLQHVAWGAQSVLFALIIVKPYHPRFLACLRCEFVL